MQTSSKLVFFLKKIGKQSFDAQQKQKTQQKKVIQLEKINIDSNSDVKEFQDSEFIQNYHLASRGDFQVKDQNILYRSLQSRPNLAQNQRVKDEIIQVMMKNAIKKCMNNDIINENDKSVSRNRLYRMPISTNKIKEKYDKNLGGFFQIPNIQDQAVATTSHNFNTYQQFKQFMTKLSDQSQLIQSSQNKKIALIMNSNKKCSIVPVFKPTSFKQNDHNDPKMSIVRFQQYMLAKKTKIHLQKSLMVKSKKQQLATHIISRYKMKQKTNRQQNRMRTLEEEPLNFINHNIKLLQSESQMTVQGRKKQKQVVSSKNRQTHRSKHHKNISFFTNIHNQQGIYEQKLKSYRQFLFIINFAHKIFDPLMILEGSTVRQDKLTIFRPTYYIGYGNNSMLLRSLMKRRVWWDEVKESQIANFVWTQLKITSIFQTQQSGIAAVDIKKIQQSKIKVSMEEPLFYSKVKNRGQKSKNQKDQLSVDKLFVCDKWEKNFQKNKKPSKLNISSIIPKGLMFRAPFTQSQELKILTKYDYEMYTKIGQKCLKEDNFDQRLRYLPKDYLNVKTSTHPIQVHNHFQFNHYIGNKKSLFYHMRLYYQIVKKPIGEAFPLTFHIQTGQNDVQFKKFFEEYQRISKEEKHLKNIWILKPGENSNRGCGIIVIKQLKQLKKHLKKPQKHKNGDPKTFIIQKYIQHPLLYRGRKFDIRHYMIISGMNNRIRAYWYGQGYIRTSSYMFNLELINDPMIHLTNDAIQKQSEDYGCYEEGNKISYNQLLKYFHKQLPQMNFDFGIIFSKMRDLARDAIFATYPSLDPHNRLHNFQILGLDFMIDQSMNVMLIQVNTNPCLQISSSILSRIIPCMLDQALRVCLDPLFPPSVHYSNNTKHLVPDCNIQKLQMELIFDSGRDGQVLRNLYKKHESQYSQMMELLKGSEQELEQTYNNQGAELQQAIQYETLLV